jgi:two-component system LytT family response regulator
MQLRIVIIEDEPLSQYYLANLLQQLPLIDLTAKVSTEEEAVAAVNDLLPDLVFLDIELHTGTGFEVLRKTEQKHFAVIFTTALEQHAIKIIKLSGVPFLQKPIDADELANLVNTFIHKKEMYTIARQHLLQTLHNNYTPFHMALYDEEAVTYVQLEDILYIATENGTCFYLHDGCSKIDMRPLKEIESLLAELHFFRATATHIVNIKKIKAVAPTGDHMRLVNETTIPLSVKKWPALMEQLVMQ